MRDFGPNIERDAAYLATVNQSSGAWSYALQTLPRAKGRGTRVVITEYELPRKPLMPHDAIVDAIENVVIVEEEIGIELRIWLKSPDAAEFLTRRRKMPCPTGVGSAASKA